MTILIANIGKSDLAVKPQGTNYYLPIGFDRDEPNEDITGLDTYEKDLWENRGRYVAELICTELDVKYQQKQRGNNIIYDFDVLELTGKIWDAYKPNPTNWEDRICLGRIGGVLWEAKQKYGVNDVYIFVTNQLPPQSGDSIHLFEILNKWIKRKNWGLTLHPVYLASDKKANDQDLMLDEYYKFFRTLPVSEEILVSIKGGTPQMLTALKVQTFAATVRQHLFLEPQLVIKKLLTGEYSSCKAASYWQYRRSQKYQTVQLLLNRWDFNGASEVLSDWQDTVDHLIKVGVVAKEISQESEEADISQHKTVINSANNALKMAVGYLNLDQAYAENQAVPSLGNLADLKKSYNHLLNLYTQCCLFDKLDRMADFLTRMGSFYEETLHELIRHLGIKYFDRNTYPDDWLLKTGFLLQDNNNLAQAFYQLECQLDYSKLCDKIQRNNCLASGVWVRSAGGFKLPGRLTKRNFVEALLQLDNHNQTLGQTILTAMKTLDYWFAKRNQLIHGAKGVSKLRMQEALEEDKRLKKAGQMDNNDISNTVDDACDANQILTQMANIARSTLTLMGTTQPPSVTESNPADYLHPEKEPYYIYSDIRKWVIDTLNQDV
jgi:hypothetical protein